MRYANKTVVSSEKSRVEIERTLMRYGAQAFGYMAQGGTAQIGFEACGRRIRMSVVLPRRDDFKTSPSGNRWKPARAEIAWQQACRQRWRALALVVKAKLEAVEAGVATFEDEFLPYIILPNGQSISQWIRPQLAQVYSGGGMPQLLLEKN